jgi:ribosomal protein S12 methylthiotransferase
VDEIVRLLSQGLYEFNLVAQDLGSYGLDRGKAELLDLINAVSQLKDDFWLRLLYIHPDRFPSDLLELMAADKRILPYFDIPFQHACEKVLKAMGRRGDGDEYLSLVDSIREKLPSAVIRSTFLVGFPEEDEAAFEELLDFQKRASLDWVGVFAFSAEEGTEAAALPGRIPRKAIQRRKALLEQRQSAITQARLDRFVGRNLPVLIEEAVENSDFFLARAYLQAPEVDSLVVLRGQGFRAGELVQARIVQRNGIDLEAVPQL